jgi:predicted TIM-barrel fold metal-dependent hydrolase
MCDFCAWQGIAKERYGQFCHILRKFLDEFGRERVMFGTDAPLLEDTMSSKEWVEMVRNLPHQSPPHYPFTEEEVSALLGGNARGLLASIPQQIR